MKAPPMFPRKRRSKAEMQAERDELNRALDAQLLAAGYVKTGEVNSFGEKWTKPTRPNTQTEQERP